jgi:viroplasmin and RNaseH domain-containing protein
MKVYVVFKGRVLGVYKTWMDASAQVSGYPDNIHCSFLTREAGEEAYAQYQVSLKNKVQEVKLEEEAGVATDNSKETPRMTTKDALLVFLLVLVVL